MENLIFITAPFFCCGLKFEQFIFEFFEPKRLQISCCRKYIDCVHRLCMQLYMQLCTAAVQLFLADHSLVTCGLLSGCTVNSMLFLLQFTVILVTLRPAICYCTTANVAHRKARHHQTATAAPGERLQSELRVHIKVPFCAQQHPNWRHSLAHKWPSSIRGQVGEVRDDLRPFVI